MRNENAFEDNDPQDTGNPKTGKTYSEIANQGSRRFDGDEGHWIGRGGKGL